MVKLEVHLAIISIIVAFCSNFLEISAPQSMYRQAPLNRPQYTISQDGKICFHVLIFLAYLHSLSLSMTLSVLVIVHEHYCETRDVSNFIDTVSTVFYR